MPHRKSQTHVVTHGTRRGYREARCRCEPCRTWQRNSMREYAAKRKAQDGVHPSTACRQRNGGKRTTYERNCSYCGAPFTTTTKATTACSVSCGHWFRAHGRGSTNRALARIAPDLTTRVAQQPVHVSTHRRLTSGQCRVCSSWFVSFHLDVTCSTGCKNIRDREVVKLHKDKRRAVKRDAYRDDVYRRRVFEADGYRCHLCRRKTNPAKAVPHPSAPTIDHVIPLSKGGTHEPVNCRTACFQCNSTKGDRGGGEQLLLIAL